MPELEDQPIGVPTGVRPTPSLKEHLRASARRLRARKTKDVALPGYDELHIVFRALDDYTEVRDIAMAIAKRRGLTAAEREIDIAIQTLLLSSVDSYATVEAERHDIGLPLGVELYQYIWGTGDTEEDGTPLAQPGTDSEAVMLLFDGNTMALISVATELDLWFKNTNQEADEELLGN